MKTFTLKEFQTANGISKDTLRRRMKSGEISIEFARVKRFKCPIQYDSNLAKPYLAANGYELP